MQNIPTISSIATNKKAAFKAANLNSIFSVSSDSKTIKGEKYGYLTGVLYLAPHNTVTSGKIKTVCPSAIAAQCFKACLYSAGRGAFNSVQAGRIKRTESYLNDAQAFMVAVWYDIRSLIKKAERKGLQPVVRLNGTSDINYNKIVFTNPEGVTGNIFDMFKDTTFYDYTKNTFLSGEALPANYHLTYSYSESNLAYATKAMGAAIKAKAGLAIVFRDKALPATFQGLPVVNGDDSDLRFLDNKDGDIKGAYVVGLYAKGDAKKDATGFVIDNVTNNGAA